MFINFISTTDYVKIKIYHFIMLFFYKKKGIHFYWRFFINENNRRSWQSRK